MIYKIIAAFDKQIKAFMPLQCVNDMPDEDIVESNRRGVIQGKIPAALAANLDIYQLGSFDDKTGLFEPLKEPYLLVSLADFLPKKVEPAQGEQVNA